MSFVRFLQALRFLLLEHLAIFQRRSSCLPQRAGSQSSEDYEVGCRFESSISQEAGPPHAANSTGIEGNLLR